MSSKQLSEFEKDDSGAYNDYELSLPDISKILNRLHSSSEISSNL